jgi:adenylosuccinate lyase
MKNSPLADFSSYQSPFSWRYGSPEMRTIWGEVNKRLIWRQLWVALAETQMEWDLVTAAQAADLTAHQADVDVAQSLAIEARLHHDLMAEIKVYAAQCPLGGGIIHLGATSMDIKDNAEVLQTAQSLELILEQLKELLGVLAIAVERYAALPVLAFTHLQPAEPTTLGYRLANFAQDLLTDYETLLRARRELKGKGFKGAVGNAASYVMLYGGLEGQRRFENLMSKALGLPFFEVATQTYSRKQDYSVLSALAGLAATGYKFAFDLRLLQSEVIGELGEPFGEAQVCSSAMPFKRNPIEAEKIDSLARAVSTAPLTAWNNYANSLLERTLDDSANRRTLFPETFLAMDEILSTLTKIMSGLQVNETMMQHNLQTFGPFAAIERVLMAAVKAGADRQEMHEVLRTLSMDAWRAVQAGQPNPLVERMSQDERITHWVAAADLKKLFAVEGYTGIAESRAHATAQRVRAVITE